MPRTESNRKNHCGVRVKKLFEGFADPFEGTVVRHYPVENLYHVIYDDGDSEDMTEDDVLVYMISPHPATEVVHEGLLLGVQIYRYFTETEKPLQGNVTGLVKSTGMYEVTYEDGDVEHISESEIKENMANSITHSEDIVREDPRQIPIEKSKEEDFIKRPQVDMTKSLFRYIDHEKDDVVVTQEDMCDLLDELETRNADDDPVFEPPASLQSTLSAPKSINASQLSPLPSPSNSTDLQSEPCLPFKKNSMAYDALRRVVNQLLDLSSPSHTRPGLIKEELNVEVKSKRGLVRFVKAGGLRPLCILLEGWREKEDMRSVLFLLKVLIAIPFVNVESVANSKIGKEIKRVSKMKKRSGVLSRNLIKSADLADYIIKTWRSEADRISKGIETSNAADSTSTKRLGNSKSASFSNKSGTSSSNGAAQKSSNGSKSYSHLSQLIGNKKDPTPPPPSKPANDVLGSILGKRVSPSSSSLRPDWIKRQEKMKASRFRSNWSAASLTDSSSNKKPQSDGTIEIETKVTEERQLDPLPVQSNTLDQTVTKIDGKILKHNTTAESPSPSSISGGASSSGTTTSKQSTSVRASPPSSADRSQNSPTISSTERSRRIKFGTECKVHFDKEAPSNELDLPWNLVHSRRSSWAKVSEKSSTFRNGGRRHLTPGPRTQVKSILKTSAKISV